MSKTSQSIFGVLGAVHFKDRVDFLKPGRSGRVKTPAMPQKHYNNVSMQIQNRTVYTIEPLDGQAAAGRDHDASPQSDGMSRPHMIYFHGGGYSMEASGLHFALMKTLVKKTGCPLSYVDYPLAPEHTATEAVSMCLETYEKLQAQHPDRSFVLIGDSAGGGLALALAMKIRDVVSAEKTLTGSSGRMEGPVQLILFSPWLDISLSNGEIPEYEPRDVILETSGLKKIGDIYRGDLPADHYLVSPKFGDLAGIGPIAVFFGTEEILYPDCEEFCEAARRGGFPVTGHVYQGMQHDWVILPMEEARRAIEEACRLVLASASASASASA